MTDNLPRVGYPDPEVEVPDDSLQNVQGERPQLTEENFAKLCKTTTELRNKLDSLTSELEGAFSAAEQKIHDIEQRLDQLEVADHVVKEMKNDVQDIAQIISTLRLEAIEIEQIKP